jgi:hypothetical protein
VPLALDLLFDLREGVAVGKWGWSLTLLVIASTLVVGAFAVRQVLMREDSSRSPAAEPVTGLTGTFTREFSPTPSDWGRSARPSWCIDVSVDIRDGDGDLLAHATTARPTAERVDSCQVHFSAEIPRSTLVSVGGVVYTWQELQQNAFSVEVFQTVNPCEGWMACYE